MKLFTPFTRLTLAAGLLSITALLGGAARPAQAAPPPGYHLVWHDEFDQKLGSAPDPSKWQLEVHPAGWVNHEQEEYTTNLANAHIVADPQSTDGHVLQIAAIKDGPNHYTSGRLTTNGKYDFTYGYVEARVKMAYGQGVWPAFWMLGQDINTTPWPNCGEVDIMENIGNKDWYNQNISSMHSETRNGGNALHASYYLPASKGSFHSNYHVFAALWKKDSITFSVDGHPFETRTVADLQAGKWPYNAPFFIILNLAVGGDFPKNPDATTTFPQKLDVDYVRVYKNN